MTEKQFKKLLREYEILKTIIINNKFNDVYHLYDFDITFEEGYAIISNIYDTKAIKVKKLKELREHIIHHRDYSIIKKNIKKAELVK